MLTVILTDCLVSPRYAQRGDIFTIKIRIKKMPCVTKHTAFVLIYFLSCNFTLGFGN
jgi:hypothetical protein